MCITVYLKMVVNLCPELAVEGEVLSAVPIHDTCLHAHVVTDRRV